MYGNLRKSKIKSKNKKRRGGERLKVGSNSMINNKKSSKSQSSNMNGL